MAGTTKKAQEAKKVAVLGAGVGGLAATKTALEYGLKPTCFEQRSDLGGIWYQEYPFEAHLNIGARTYKNLIQNGAKTYFAYSDYPPKKSDPFILPIAAAKDYLDDYASSFGLRKHIEFGRQVSALEKANDYETTGRWKVTTVDAESKENAETQEFDAVLICTGFFSEPLWPEIPGEANFKGEIKHSGQVWDISSAYRNKRVGIIGGGISAFDMASAMAPYADKVNLIIRPEGAHVLPLFYKPSKTWEELFFSRKHLTGLPLPKVRKLWETTIAERFNSKKLGFDPDNELFSGPVAISGDCDTWIHCGKIKVSRGDVVKFGANRVYLRDSDEVIEVDDIVYATGYKPKIPFLKDPQLNPEDGSKLNSWMHMFPMGQKHPTLFTVGYFYVYGAPPLQMELQARAACGIISGQLTLPDDETMMSRIETERAGAMALRGRYPGEVNGLNYSLEISEFIGCHPDLQSIIKRDPILGYRCWKGPVTPPQFRLFGPGAKWDQSREQILNMKTNSHDSTIRKQQSSSANKSNK